MPKRHLAIFLALVLLPLGGALALGLATVHSERQNERGRLTRTLTERLDDLARRCRGLQDEWEARLRRGAADIDGSPASLRAAGAAGLPIRQAFLVDYQGRLAYPIREGASQSELAFLDRTAAVLAGGWLPQRPESGDWPRDGGWYRWYWRDGLQWFFWLPRRPGLLGLELNRAALLSDLAGRLEGPSLTPAQKSANRVRVVDDQGRVFLQWGAWAGGADALAARVGLDGCLEGWQLVWEADPARLGAGGPGSALAVGLSLAALTAAAAALALYFLQGYRRQLREAGQRVSFVNQVSHELKTPLTNIRLYAELLRDGLEPGQARLREYADIVEREGRRLGRLIHNVLSFGRRGKGDAARPQLLVPDEAVRDCLSSFSASFAERGLAVEADLACAEPRRFDPDLLDQVLGNLLSNAEKYAASGGRVRVESRPAEGGFELAVRDWGPGVPPDCERRLFRPFERFDASLTGAGGSGLGLYLVRELARRHGGDARYEACRPGARFVVRLAAPAPAAQGDAP